jgi:predicted Zn-dependent peptidase
MKTVKKGTKNTHKPKSSHRHKKTTWLCDRIQFRYNELETGTKIIQIHHSDNKNLTIEAYINFGSAMEPSNKKGISHLVEHLVFRMNTKFDNKTLKEFLTENGIYNNAYTTKKTVSFYLSGGSNFDNFNRMLYVLSERLLKCSFTKEELDIERNIVIQELYKGYDEPNNDKWHLIDENYYAGHPLGESIIGTVETLNSITIDDINEYYEKHFIPSNFVIYIYGNIPEFNTNIPAGLCNYYLAHTPNKKTQHKLWTKSTGLLHPFNSKHLIGISSIPEINKKLIDLKRQDKIFQTHYPPKCKEIIKFNKPNLKQSHIVFLFPTSGLYNPNRHLVVGISHIIRDGHNKIYNTIRNKYGLSYVIHVSTDDCEEAGYLYISINVNNDKTQRGIGILKDLLKTAQKSNFITQSELDIYKHAVHAEHTELKRSNAVNHFLNRIMTYREIHNIDDFYDKYYNISLDDINKEAARLLNLDNARIYVYGS